MHLFYIRKMQNKSIIRHLDPTVNVSALNLQYGLGYIYSKELHKYKHHPNVCGTDFTIRTEITRFARQMNNNIFKILNFSKQTYIDFSVLFWENEICLKQSLHLCRHDRKKLCANCSLPPCEFQHPRVSVYFAILLSIGLQLFPSIN